MTGLARRRIDAALGRRGLIAIALAQILLLYLITRLALLDRLPYFVDEGTHGRFTRSAARSTDDLFISLEIAKEPLMIWLAVVWEKLGSPPLEAVRMASIASGLGTVAMIALLGRRFGGTVVGLSAAATCVVLPFMVVHDVIGIMEPLLTFLLAAALLLQIELARRPRLRVAALLGLVFAAAILTKESGKIALFLLPVSLLCFDWRAPDVRRRLGVWGGCVALALTVAAGGELLLRSSALYDRVDDIRSVSILYPVRDVGEGLAHPFRWLRISWPLYQPAFAGYFTLPLLAAAVAGAVLGYRRRRDITLVLLAWIVVPLVPALLLPISPYPRHILYLVPPIVVLAAYGLVEGVGWVYRRVDPPRLAAGLAAGGLLLAFAPALLRDARVLANPDSTKYPGGDDSQYVTGPVAGSPWKDVAATLRRETSGQGAVTVRDQVGVEILELLLDNDPRYVFIFPNDRRVGVARFVLTDELPFHDRRVNVILREGRFREIGVWPRPRGGATVTLYERGSVG